MLCLISTIFFIPFSGWFTLESWGHLTTKIVSWYHTPVIFQLKLKDLFWARNEQKTKKKCKLLIISLLSSDLLQPHLLLHPTNIKMVSPCDVPVGVITGDDVTKLLKHAKDNGYAIPAFNCTRCVKIAISHKNENTRRTLGYVEILLGIWNGVVICYYALTIYSPNFLSINYEYKTSHINIIR